MTESEAVAGATTPVELDVDSGHVDSGHVDSGHVDSGHVDPGHVDSVAALRAAVLVLARRLRYQVAGDDDLSATELAVLGRVGRCGPMTPGQLARAEHVRPPSMTKVIESLEGRRMLSREPHPTDRRQYLVSRTEAAEAFVEASRQVRTVWLADHLTQLTDSERAAIEAAIPALSRLAELP